MKRIEHIKDKKISNGFTLVEMLCTVLLVGLVSAGLVTGVNVGIRQFNRSMRLSESQQLYTTLQTILNNELKYTNSITLKSDSQTVDTFYSVSYALEHSATSLYVLDSDTGIPVSNGKYGQLAIGSESIQNYNRLLGKKSYTKNLGATASIQYNASGNYFVVSLAVGVNGDDTPYIDGTFHVRPLNLNDVGVSS